jgi:hypothetical protein
MLSLAARHYTRAKVGRKIGGPARSLLLRDPVGSILFLWQWAKDNTRRDGQDGFNCVMFRNESSVLSSQIILDAEQEVQKLWGSNRCFTYVDASKIKSTNPGYCFQNAGWKRIGKSASGKYLLEKFI